VLPFIGPSSFRDGVGWLADFYTDPITYVDPSRDRNILWGTRLVSRRSELLDAEEIVKTAALDPYEFIRDAYLQRRRNLVYDGNPPPDKDEDVDIKVKPKSEGFRWPWSSAPSAARVPAAAPGSDRAPLTPAQAEERERAQQQKNSVQDNARSEPRAGLTPAQAEEREREITPQPGAQEEPRAEAAPSSGQNGRVARVWLPVAR
jgi:phospholipid-binding lipoprotein MlaA